MQSLSDSNRSGGFANYFCTNPRTFDPSNGTALFSPKCPTRRLRKASSSSPKSLPPPAFSRTPNPPGKSPKSRPSRRLANSGIRPRKDRKTGPNPRRRRPPISLPENLRQLRDLPQPKPAGRRRQAAYSWAETNPGKHPIPPPAIKRGQSPPRILRISPKTIFPSLIPTGFKKFPIGSGLPWPAANPLH